MRGSKTDFLEDALINGVLRNSAYTPAVTVYAALFTVMPAEDGTGTEVSGNGYARQAVTFAAPTPAGETENSSDVTFGPATPAGWGTIVGWGIFDASTAGNMLYHGPLAEPSTIFVGLNVGDILHSDNHGLANDDQVFLKGDNLPAGLVEDLLRFVISVSGSNFQLSATMGGGAIALTTDGDGDVAKERTVAVNLNDEFKFAAGDLEIDER
ncbi:MAG: hypothetical protein LN413_00295 [Candidatus Thermoplasmatota archaeon]|nr:hypothetical protein [Candidatus Thermoplasmatota archaeon]